MNCYVYYSNYIQLERFSFECRKTKTKVITLTNHNTRKQRNEANACNWRQARENACDQVMIGFGLVSHSLKKWREFY